MISRPNPTCEVAHCLGLNPVEVRLRNYYPDKTNPPKGLASTHYGQPVTDGILADLTGQLVKSSDYQNRRREIAAFNKSNQWVKRGLAFSPVKFGISFNARFLNQAGALMLLYADGSIQLNHGGTEMGQGLNTKVAQIVAHEFGVDIGAVKITATNTGKVPNTSATAASSGADIIRRFLRPNIHG